MSCNYCYIICLIWNMQTLNLQLQNLQQNLPDTSVQYWHDQFHSIFLKGNLNYVLKFPFLSGHLFIPEPLLFHMYTHTLFVVFIPDMCSIWHVEPSRGITSSWRNLDGRNLKESTMNWYKLEWWNNVLCAIFEDSTLWEEKRSTCSAPCCDSWQNELTTE